MVRQQIKHSTSQYSREQRMAGKSRGLRLGKSLTRELENSTTPAVSTLLARSRALTRPSLHLATTQKIFCTLHKRVPSNTTHDCLLHHSSRPSVAQTCNPFVLESEISFGRLYWLSGHAHSDPLRTCSVHREGVLSRRRMRRKETRVSRVSGAGERVVGLFRGEKRAGEQSVVGGGYAVAIFPFPPRFRPDGSEQRRRETMPHRRSTYSKRDEAR